jgi:hypothetical protein
MLSFADLLERCTTSKSGGYDPKSYELAEHFLPNGTEKAKDALAQAIQTAIDDHLWEPDEQ